MGTLMQSETARLTLEMVGSGKNVSKGKILKKVGYKASIAKNPDKVFETEGFKEALLEQAGAFGLTKELIESSLVEDILKKPQRRVRELELGAAILKLTEKSPSEGNKTLIINITGETASRYGLLGDKK